MSDLPLWADVPAVVNDLAGEVIGVAIGVHRDLGPGLLESPYKLVLAERLRQGGHDVAVDRRLPLVVDGLKFDKAFVADIVVDDLLLLEIKAVQRVHFAMIAQTKTYLRLGRFPLGLLLNFHGVRLADRGIVRVVP